MPGSRESNLEFLSPNVWHLFGQTFLSESYLQPYKSIKKTNVQNGYIEREIHGAMHASRVALATVMLHRLCVRQFPEIVAKHLRTLCEFTELTEDQLFCLISYLGLGHDAARQDEVDDMYEKQSAEKIEAFLCSNKLNPRLAKIVSCLLIFKDRSIFPENLPDDYLIHEDVIESLQYVRLLIGLADYFDIIRCIETFKFKPIKTMLCKVFPYRKEKDAPVFFDFAKHWFQLLKDQKDLYCPTKLLGPNDEIYSLALSPDDYSLSEKVQVEHADNVIVAILDSLKKSTYFALLLPTYADISPTLYNPKNRAFNPYIHGTNSTTLALMTQTRFRLMSPVELLKVYHLAPFSGEICRGGLSRSTANGNSCFGKLISSAKTYSLDHILNVYARQEQSVDDKAVIISKLEKQIKYSDHMLWSNIIIINIYIARLRQLGVNLALIPALNQIFDRINDVIEIYYLFFVFNKHLEAESNASIDGISCKLQDFLQELKKGGISCTQIYQDPSSEKCQPLINLLRTYDLLFRYTVRADSEPEPKQADEVHDLYYDFNCESSHSVAALIFKDICTNHRHFQSKFRVYERSYLETIDALKRHLEITRELLNEPVKPLQLSKKDSDFIQNPFPVIFVYDKEDAMCVTHTYAVEYRSQRPLMIGEDIRILATDTAENVIKLKDYCKRHRLANVLIVTFDALIRARNTLRTEKPFTHSNICVQSPLQELHDFCAQQRQRLAQNGEYVIRSINLFEDRAAEIINSKQMSANQAKLALKKCAHNLFGHRDFYKRLLADVLIFISSLALVGLAIGIGRVAHGHSFFFSGAKTEREHAFDDATDKMFFVM